MWTCFKCREQVEDQFEMCWKCSSSKTDSIKANTETNKGSEDKRKKCPSCLNLCHWDDKFCRNCGSGNLIPLERKNKSTVKKQYNTNCPSCHTDNTQRIQMFCMANSSTSSSVAIGLNSDVDMGVATIETESLSNLTANFLPENPPRNNGAGSSFGFMLIIVSAAGFFISATSSIPILGLACFIFLGIGVMLWLKKDPDYDEKYRSWEQKKEMFEKGWLCLRCGNSWIPD